MSISPPKKLQVGTDSLGFYLSRANIVFRELLKQSLEASSLSDYIKPGMGNLMFALYERDGQSKTELARKLRLSKMTITRLVRDVEKQKLVTIEADDRDGRASRVVLTPLARRLESDYYQLALQLEDRIATNFTSQQLCDFGKHLKNLVDSLESDLF